MITYSKIENKTDSKYKNLLELYQSAFPEHERRSETSLSDIIKTESAFNVIAIMSKNKFVGFLNYWQFKEFDYIEHFAISDQFRNQKFGSETIKTFINRDKKRPIVLEVEPPNTVLACKRIEFYERLGFYILANKYKQPPYSINGPSTIMYIMCNDYLFANKNFKLIQKTLYKEVYKL